MSDEPLFIKPTPRIPLSGLPHYLIHICLVTTAFSTAWTSTM